MSRISMLSALFVFLAPSMLGGLLIGAYPGYMAYEYAWKNANFCISCHVHDYATVGWKKSIHGDLTTCHDCHHQPLKAYVKEMWVMLTKSPHFPEDLHHTPYVRQDLCASCHLSGHQDRSTLTGPMPIEDIYLIPKVDRSVLHKIHLDKKTDLVLLNSQELSSGERAADPHATRELSREKGAQRMITCADCHGGPTNRGHNFGAADLTCIRCHETHKQNKFGRSFGCQSCHFQDFLAPVTSEPTRLEK